MSLSNHADPYSFLAGLTTSSPPTFETEWLDFKGTMVGHDVLKTWSEAVSGFANTEGGVLIWGIDCRKTNGVDAACGLSLIDDPLALKSRLLTNINQTTDPPVQGISLREVLGSDGKGFLVCLIPESCNKPHRAEQKTNKSYMIRAGDSFVVPSPSLLRSMFYPRVAPDIQIEIAPIWEGAVKRQLGRCKRISVGFRSAKTRPFAERKATNAVAYCFTTPWANSRLFRISGTRSKCW